MAIFVKLNKTVGSKLLSTVTAVSLVLGSSSLALAPMAAAAQGPDSVADLAEKLIDAVVNISTTQHVNSQRQVPLPQVPEGSPFQDFFDQFFDQQQRGGKGGGQDKGGSDNGGADKGGPDNGDDNGGSGGGDQRTVQSLGSGFVIDPSGIIITNNHVIEDADEITANFNDGTKLKAELIGRDEKTDIAVLRVKSDKPLPFVNFGDSEKMRVGDWVMAIGNPFGLGGTVTTGIVSARNRDINSGPYDNFLQTDAAINRGNSGGPLFNEKGEVVGINTAIISPSGGSIGIGFSIPSEIAKGVVDQLRQFGETHRGWLGVNIQDVTDDLAESLGLDHARGALVAGVTDGGPAAAAKLQAGDVIVGFDGHPIKEMRELPRIVANTPVGKTVDVDVMRKGSAIKLQVTLGRLEEGEKLANATGKPEAAKPKPVEKVLGLTLGALDEQSRQDFKIGPDVKGVLITAVEPNSVSADKGVQPGDTVVEVAQGEVKTPDDVAAAVAKQKDLGRKSALLLLSNPAGELRFVAVKID